MSLDILQIRADQKLKEHPELPKKLVKVSWPETKNIVKTRSFKLTGSGSINEKPMDMSRIDHVVIAGSTEVWEVSNPGAEMYHNFHIHGVHFKILEVNGKAPPGHFQGLKDTFYLAPQSKVKLLVRFANYTDEKFPYMYHCHILLHEDNGMMGQFLVVKPGTHPSRKIQSEEHHMKH